MPKLAELYESLSRNNILNIHGYGGTAHNTAYNILNKFCPGQIVSPQFDYDKYSPNNIVSILERLIEAENISVIVGTSLGGFFACCMNRKHEMPIILVNPCLLPFITLRQISNTYNFARYGKQLFELFGQHMGELDRRYISTIVGKSDEIINHETTTKYFIRNKRWYKVNGGHHLERTDELSAAFQNILIYYNKYLPEIQGGETLRNF